MAQHQEARALALFRSWAYAAAGGIQEIWQRLLSLERGFQRRRRSLLPQQAALDALDRQAFAFAIGRIQAPGRK